MLAAAGVTRRRDAAASRDHDEPWHAPRLHLISSHPARSEPMERLLLLDGNGLIYRGYFALIDQPLTTSKGELVTAVFGFTNIVLRAIQDAKPDRVAVAFDLPKPHVPPRPLRRVQGHPDPDARRHARADPEGERGRQARSDIPDYEQEGFEADDAIATLVGQAEALGFDVVDPHRRPGHAPARLASGRS